MAEEKRRELRGRSKIVGVIDEIGWFPPQEVRRIPLCMTPDVERRERVQATLPKKELADRVSNDANGGCPLCVESLSADALHEHLLSAEQDQSDNEEEYGHGMQNATANGIPVRVCLQHLVIVPLRDQDQI